MRKKILLATTSLISLTPLATLLACNNPAPKPKIKEVIDENEKTVIYLNQVESVEDLMTKFNELTNVFMPQPLNQMVEPRKEADKDKAPYISRDSYDRLNNYTKKIDFKVKELNFKFNDQTYNIKLDKIIDAVNKVSQSVNQDYEKFLNNDELGPLMIKSLQGVPNMPALLSKMMTIEFAMETTGFMSLPKYGEKYGYEYYLDMMEAYHDFSRDLSQSDVFKAWIDGKTYKLIESTENAENKTIHKIISVNSGEGYDLKMEPNDFLPPASKLAEIHNLEAQLVLSLSNVYTLAQKQTQK